MTIQTYRRNDPWIPTPLGVATAASIVEEFRRNADVTTARIVCAFALVGLAATLTAAVVGGPTFDFGAILAAAG